MASGFSADGGGMEFYGGAGRSILGDTGTVIKSDNKIFNRCANPQQLEIGDVWNEIGDVWNETYWMSGDEIETKLSPVFDRILTPVVSGLSLGSRGFFCRLRRFLFPGDGGFFSIDLAGYPPD
ncbi:hypothetical protein YC2023_055316 [Brassica napus]